MRVIRWLCTYSRGREKKFLPSTKNRIRQKSVHLEWNHQWKRRVHGRDETPTFVPSPLSLYYSSWIPLFRSWRAHVRRCSDPLSRDPKWDEIPRNFYFILFIYFFLCLILIVTFFFTISLAKSYGLLSRMMRWSFEFRGGSEDFGQRRESSRKWKRVGKIRARSEEQWDIAISPEPARIFPSHSEPRDPAYLKVLKRVDDA